MLKVIFVHAAMSDGFEPADLNRSDITRFESVSDVKQWAVSQDCATQEGQTELFAVMRDWIKVIYDAHTLHYEFRDEALGLITITAE